MVRHVANWHDGIRITLQDTPLYNMNQHLLTNPNQDLNRTVKGMLLNKRHLHMIIIFKVRNTEQLILLTLCPEACLSAVCRTLL